MQLCQQTGFVNRIQYYGAHSLSDQLKTSEDYSIIQTVIVICSFTLFLHLLSSSKHQFVDVNTGRNELKLLEYIFLQIEKLYVPEDTRLGPKKFSTQILIRAQYFFRQSIQFNRIFYTFFSHNNVVRPTLVSITSNVIRKKILKLYKRF